MDMAQGRNTPPMAQGPTYLEGDDGTWRCGDNDMNDGSVCVNKVASSSSAGGIDMKEGSGCLNKVASSSDAKGDKLKGESTSSSAHAKAKCMGKYRIMVKGSTRHGSACCRGTS